MSRSEEDVDRYTHSTNSRILRLIGMGEAVPAGFSREKQRQEQGVGGREISRSHRLVQEFEWRDKMDLEGENRVGL